MPIDYLSTYKNLLNHAAIEKRRAEEAPVLEEERYASMKQAYQALSQYHANSVNLDQEVIQIGTSNEFSPADRKIIRKNLQAFIPWRKGPYSVFGTDIDAEWKSHLKWERLQSFIGNLKGKRIADIGCNNGYYLFRIASHQPEIAIGFDPVGRYWYMFHALQQMTQAPHIYYELLGVDDLPLYPTFFDTVFCMGILYHHPNPVQLLRGIYQSMKPSGKLIIETAGIPGEESIALFPEKRYANMGGSWYFPTASCLLNWIKRAGFTRTNLFLTMPLRSEEQRKTEWAPYDSFAEFLDPKDPTRTIEGYPAPLRFYLVTHKPGNKRRLRRLNKQLSRDD